jgi:hypothetical protein
VFLRLLLELLGKQERDGQIQQDAECDHADDDVLSHGRPLEFVRRADVEQAQAQEHERDPVECDVSHG